MSTSLAKNFNISATLLLSVSIFCFNTLWRSCFLTIVAFFLLFIAVVQRIFMVRGTSVGIRDSQVTSLRAALEMLRLTTVSETIVWLSK